MFDLVIRSGRVLDPGAGFDRIADVGVKANRIVAIAPRLYGPAREIIEASGRLVTPGLVDIHTHVNLAPGPWGVDAAGLVALTGATTWVDAGSVGAWRVGALRRASQVLPLQLKALLNISTRGLDAETGESADLVNLSVGAAVDAVRRHVGFVAGIKVRIDRRTVGDLGLEPLRRAVEVARQVEVPVMVHVGYGPPFVAEVLAHLDRGDILTHCASGTPDDITAQRRLASHVLAAHRRGVHLDLGHGAGSFSFPILESYLDAGIVPLCSSDVNTRALERRARGGGGALLPDVTTKLIACGVSVPEVIAASTWRPARALGLQAGSLQVGQRADITVLVANEEERRLTDPMGATRPAGVVVSPYMTVVGGVVARGPGESRRTPDWRRRSTE